MGGIVGSIVGGFISSSGAKKAANAQAAAADAAAQAQLDMFYQNRDDLMPWRTAGLSALETYMNLVLGKGLKYGDDGKVIEGEYTDITDEDRYNMFEKSPGYQFRLDEGMKTVQNSAAAKGNLVSGATLKALERYGQDYVSGEYRNYLGDVAGLAGVGQSATNTIVGLGANAATNQGNALMAAGDARASGYIGQANAWTNALQGVAGSFGGMGGGSFNLGAFANGLPWSDVRLKTDIVRIGERNGLPWYEFRYLWEHGKRRRGVMAQDLLRLKPEAVFEQEGFLAVDYDLLGLDMEEVPCH